MSRRRDGDRERSAFIASRRNEKRATAARRPLLVRRARMEPAALSYKSAASL
jgi:hypothetical protein